MNAGTNGLEEANAATEAARPTQEQVKKVERSLDYSIKDGSAYSVMAGMGETYISPYAIALGASAAEVGLIASVPQLVSSLAQPLAGRLGRHITRRRTIVVNSVLLHALSWVFILAVPLLLPAYKIEALLVLVSLYFMTGTIGSPAWSSWMADLVPEEKRGEYFGKRNEILGAVLLASTITGGLVLGYFQQTNVITGFAILFAIACIARLVSRHYLGKMWEPEKAETKPEVISIKEYFSNANHHPMKTFTHFLSLMTLSVQISGPFFAVYWLKDLGFDYFTYTLVVAVAMIAKFISNPYWGSLIDKYGNKRVLQTTALLVASLPILFALSADLRFIILVQILSGFAWAGFELASFNYIISVSERNKTTSLVANYNFFNGVGFFIGAIIGAALITPSRETHFLFLTGIPIVFLISGIARTAIALYYVPRIKENRLSYSMSEKEFFWKATAIYPTQGVMRELQNGWKIGVKSMQTSINVMAQGTLKGKEKIAGLEESLKQLAAHEEKLITMQPPQKK